MALLKKVIKVLDGGKSSQKKLISIREICGNSLYSIIPQLFGSHDEFIRSNTLELIGSNQLEGFENEIIKSLDDTSELVVIEAIETIMSLEIRGALQKVIEKHKHKDSLVRTVVAEAIGYLGSMKDVKFLKSFLKNEKDEMVRCRIEASLSCLLLSLKLMWDLLIFFNSKDYWVRLRVVRDLTELAIHYFPSEKKLLIEKFKLFETLEETVAVQECLAQSLTELSVSMGSE